jgi:hypothetical protein
MEKKIEGLEKNVNFLYEDLEDKEKEILDLKESVDHANEICRKNTAYAQKTLVEKCSLAKELESKEKEIFEVRENRENKCKNGCEKYNRSMDDVVKYATKNRESALSLKDTVESQKSKIFCLRGHRNELLNKIDKLNSDHENDIKMKGDVISKQQDEIKTLLKQLSDQKDEILTKNSEIELLVSEKKESEELKSSRSSLADEISFAQAKIEKEIFEKEVVILKKKLAHFEKNKDEKVALLKQLDNLASNRNEELDKLKVLINKVKVEKKMHCVFKWKCKKRAFCSFDHTYLYSKVNAKSETLIPQEPGSTLCEKCGEVFSSNVKLEGHMKAEHQENLETESLRNFESGARKKIYPCENCTETFSKVSELKKHLRDCTEVSCGKCGKYFVSLDELNEHMKIIHVEKKSTFTSGSTCIVGNIKSMEEKQNQDQSEGKNSKKYPCNECNKSFRLNADVQNHKKSKHSHHDKKYSKKVNDETEVSDFICIMCKIDFKSIVEMDNHMDDKHEGRWKKYDPDVLGEGDEESDSSEESDSGEDCENSDDSKREERKMKKGKYKSQEDCLEKGEVS